MVKMWITNAKQADYFCTLVNTGDGNVHKNKSLIIIPSDTKGLSVGDKVKNWPANLRYCSRLF